LLTAAAESKDKDKPNPIRYCHNITYSKVPKVMDIRGPGNQDVDYQYIRVSGESYLMF